ncbi:MAG: hypothetical protein LBQ87_04455 [Candidatus Fibromonas sp.]|jgi:uncharacterized protein (TIGR02145 family)|nr:hypothetical protein [Candidatus Fibromonas sp.]
MPLVCLSFLLVFLLTHATAQLQYGGKVYKTVQIGTQIWMAENLNYNAKGSVCYNNNPEYCAKYGRLYNWETAMKVCPEGWHLPSNEEWEKLFRFVDDGRKTESPYISLVAYKYLRTASDWSMGTNEYGFSALPGGYGNPDGTFYNVGAGSYWWSASEYSEKYSREYGYFYTKEDGENYAFYQGKRYNSINATWAYDYKSFLYSVRCFQNSDEKSNLSISISSSPVSSSSSSVDYSVGYSGSYGSVSHEGQSYKIVQIGTQTWMAENLNYNVKGSKCYGEGGEVFCDEADKCLKKTLSDKEVQDNCAKYGRLYNWETAKKVCPEGWHLPSNEEWDKLYRFVEDGDTGTESPYRSETAGRYLKIVSDWGNGTNDYGFSALPGGYGGSDGSFSNVATRGYWWSTSEYGNNRAYLRSMVDFDVFATSYHEPKSLLQSVRCLQGSNKKSGSPVPSSSSSVGYSGSYGSVSHEGQSYKTVRIGTQTWMAENLNYEAKGSVCYNDNPEYCETYGRLYNWETAKKVCPEGWHLPSSKEWEKMLRFVDGNTGSRYYDSRKAGEYLKARSGWRRDGNGTDKYGFSALPGGGGYLDFSTISGSNFCFAREQGYWWSASEYDGNAYGRSMVYDLEKVYFQNTAKYRLFSVRCIKD